MIEFCESSCPLVMEDFKPKFPGGRNIGFQIINEQTLFRFQPQLLKADPVDPWIA